ncbi:MAG: mechanosensitive ion channel family protein [Clostridia bacterium]
MLTDKPFELGDWIEVGTYAGSVVDISFRSTRIKTISNSIVTIPNSVITSEYVINWNKLKSRRLDLTLGLHLDTRSQEIRKILKQIKVVLANNPNVIEDTIQVNFGEIADSSANIKMYMYINETDYRKFLNIKEEILCSLLALIEKDNIELAYPTQTVYIKNDEGEKV